MGVRPLGDVLRYLDAVPDPRRFNRTYTLTQLLTLTLLAVLCRCDDYEETVDWVAVRREWLGEVLDLPEGRAPLPQDLRVGDGDSRSPGPAGVLRPIHRRAGRSQRRSADRRFRG